MKPAISHMFPKRIIAVLMMLLLAGAAALAASTPAKADEGPANYSFYKLSSSLAAFFSNAQSPDENAEPINGAVWGQVFSDPGSAGAMLGYVDPDFSFSMEFLNSQISGSSSAVGYNTLVQSSQGDGSRSTHTPGMLDYAHFGATLNAMGLDSMSTGLSLGMFATIGGGLIMMLYIFTGIVDLLFAGIMTALQWLNPFKLFYEGVRAVNPTFAEGMTGGERPPGFLGGLAAWIGDWYQVLNGLAWAVLVPLFIGVLILSLVLAKNMNRGSALKKLCIRIVFIGVGLPLLGSMYTGTLNAMSGAVSSGSAGSTQVVLSTYVDFQNWAYKNRLAVPERAVIAWDATNNKPTAAALANVRNTALEINKSTNSAWSSINSTLNVGADQSWTDAAMNDRNGDRAGGVRGYTSTIDMLGRYISGQKLDAASYETAVKGDISSSSPYTSGPDGKALVGSWFNDFGDPQKSLPKIEDPAKVNQNPVVRVNNGTGLRASPAGATGGDKRFTSPSRWGCGVWVSNGAGNPMNCNMSTLSLYNYLNTSFGSDSMTMYSSNKSTSGATREMHNSVTQVGTGVMSGLYWLNSVVLLASFVLIGVGYAFMMLFSNIKRTFQVVTAIPFATIGAVAGIAKVLVYATAMILEIILTLFLYRFIQVFLISIPKIVEMPFSGALNSAGASAGVMALNLVQGGTLSSVMTVLSIVSLVLFTILALRVRKTVTKAVNEVVTKLVDKFMDTSIAPPGKGGLLPALAGGAAAGAGLSAANKAMSGRGAGAAAKQGGGNDGPGGIIAGGIPAGDGGPKGPGSSSAAGELTVGGGAGMEVTGEAGDAGPDGSGGRPGGGGNSGGPLPIGGTGGILPADAADQELARAAQSRGSLSEPGSNGSGDVTDTLAGSVDRTQAQYRAKDLAAGESAVAGGKALAKGAEAAGRGVAGDAAGAASAGMSAAGHAQDAGAKAEQSRAIGKEINAPAAGSAQGRTAAAATPASSAAGGSASSGAAGAAALSAGQHPTPAGAAGTARPQKPGSGSAQGQKATGARQGAASSASGASGQAAKQGIPSPSSQGQKHSAPRLAQGPSASASGTAPTAGSRRVPAPGSRPTAAKTPAGKPPASSLAVQSQKQSAARVAQRPSASASAAVPGTRKTQVPAAQPKAPAPAARQGAARQSPTSVVPGTAAPRVAPSAPAPRVTSAPAPKAAPAPRVSGTPAPKAAPAPRAVNAPAPKAAPVKAPAPQNSSPAPRRIRKDGEA